MDPMFACASASFGSKRSASLSSKSAPSKLPWALRANASSKCSFDIRGLSLMDSLYSRMAPSKSFAAKLDSPLAKCSAAESAVADNGKLQIVKAINKAHHFDHFIVSSRQSGHFESRKAKWPPCY